MKLSKRLQLFHRQSGIVAGIIGLVFMLVGCDHSIKTVKNGCFENHPDATIGTVMDLRFYDGHWSTLKESGRNIVCFTGKIKKTTHDLAAQQILANPEDVNRHNGAKDLYFQFNQDEFKKRIQRARSPQDQKIIEINAQLEKLRYELPFLEESPAKQQKLARQDKLQQELNKLPTADWAERETTLTEKVKTEMFDDYMNNSYWGPGIPVEFKWVVYPDGNRFELLSVASSCWEGNPVDQIINVLYLQ